MMAISKKEQISRFLKGIETGDPEAIKVVNEKKYIQHNPLTKEGNVGLAELFQRLAKTSPKVEIVRIFEDGDFVFAHTDYDFNVVEVGFEVFRVEDGFAVEHWDNLQLKPTQPNPSGHTMLDGETETADFHKTEENKEFIRSFLEEVLFDNHLNKLDVYIHPENFTEHNPEMVDGLPALFEALTERQKIRTYRKVHRVLGEGSFVLSVCEGTFEGKQASMYDLFRIKNGKIVEHWDTMEEVPHRSEWQNNNGKF